MNIARVNRFFSVALVCAVIALGWHIRIQDLQAPALDLPSVAATSITPITSVAAGSSGLVFSGDAYDVTCTVSTDTVTLYAAAHDGTLWRVYDGTACTLAVGGGRTCRFPADKEQGLAWNAFKIGAGTVASCTARQSFGPVTRASGGSGSGSVISVGLSLPAQFSVSGSPVTTSGTLSATWANQNANIVFAGPSSGGAATPAFRSLVVADLPSQGFWWSPVARVANQSATITHTVGSNVTVGTLFQAYRPISITGVTFYWHGGATTIRCKLWDDSLSAVKTTDLAVSGAGTSTCTFSTPYSLTSSKTNLTFAVSTYDTAAGNHTYYAEPSSPALPFAGSHEIQWTSLSNYYAGDAYPSSLSGGGYFLVAPVYTL